jgi:hypothetical protein
VAATRHNPPDYVHCDTSIRFILRTAHRRLSNILLHALTLRLKGPFTDCDWCRTRGSSNITDTRSTPIAALSLDAQFNICSCHVLLPDLFAQVCVTIILNDVKPSKVEITEDRIVFESAAGERSYALDLRFAGKVDVEKPSFAGRDRGVKFRIVKTDSGSLTSVFLPA